MPQQASWSFLSRTTSFRCPVVERCASAKSKQTSRRKLGKASGKGGSSGMATEGVTEPARPPDTDGWADGLRDVVAEVERAEDRPGMVSGRGGVEV